MRQRGLLVRYAAGLSFAYVLTVAEVIAIVLSLTGRTGLTAENVIVSAVLIIAGTALVTVGAVVNVSASLRWLGKREPTDAERQGTLKILRRQAAITVAPWLLTGAVLVVWDLDAGTEARAVIGSAMLFGTIATVSTGFLFTLRTLRPVLASVTPDPTTTPPLTAPGVRARLMLMWTVCTALPGLAIALLLIMRNNGWLIDRTTPIELALLVLALVAVVLGLRAMILVSMSISDPVREVVDAMAEVERGRIDHSVDVYEWSEIGGLQTGFNRMVAGLRERNLLRDLFGRHVGEEVVRRAVQENESLTGDERDVAVLFIDLVGSTQLAVTREPHEVADLLNDFFRIIVAAVDERHGLVNKFQGDAALAVFGAPLRIDGPATAALATARVLVAELGRLRVDFGIGVSAGPVFAGNVGAENRYEYTVIGDPVNEAARLTELAKDHPARVLASGTTVAAADGEAERWSLGEELTLRGRAEPTRLAHPA
ncbi:MAG TPA: adenylate/guanylate cyclase domain-containing protein [Mycobacterium sp.]|nr:adenylate/guanylate cyclase domain-containing protein [Mycobacterium sp.]